MLALLSAGVDRETILTDYEVSEPNMRASFARQKKAASAAGIQMPDYLFGSEREDLEQALSYITDHFGTVEAYLTSIGLSEAEILSVAKALDAGKGPPAAFGEEVSA